MKRKGSGVRSPTPQQTIDTVSFGERTGEDEAENIALKHCENADGKNCKVVTVFRNHRHWNDDDGTGFPYEHCAALSVGKPVAGGTSSWGAASEETRQKAEEKATNLCGGEGQECKIREWVCT